MSAAMTDTTEVALGALESLTEGTPTRINIAGRPPVCVYLVDGQVYVTDNACTHGDASLSDEGELDGFTIVCLYHNGAFDIRTGEVLNPPCNRPLRTYPVTVRNGQIWIDIAGADED
jgi:nitrite reductase/ring-hydroxylating ferredoxin subunit